MSRQRSSIVHEFYCTQCGERGIPVYRKYGKKRNVAVAAIARELACFVWGMMTDNIEMKAV